MRLPRNRWLVGLGVTVVVAVAGLVSFGPLVRSRLMAEAARRDLDVRVGRVRPGWFAVRLFEVGVEPRSGPGTRAQLDELIVRLDWRFRPVEVELRGGRVDVGPRERKSSGAGEGSLRVRGTDLSVHWASAAADASATLEGVSVDRSADGTHLQCARGSVRRGGMSASVVALTVELGAGDVLEKAHAAEAEVAWLAGSEDAPSAVAQDAPPDEPDPRPTWFRLRPLRERLALAGRALDHTIPPGADVSIEAFTWKLAPNDARVALTVGPGPLSVRSRDADAEIRFSSDSRGGSPPMTVRALLPLAGGEASLSIEGGPVSLSQLGLREGAIGLTDVDRATLGGRVQLRLADDGGALTFDADLAARAVSFRAPRIATDVIRGMDGALRARGALDDVGRLRLDDLSASLGLVHLEGSGSIESSRERVAAQLDVQLPSTRCQALLESLPTALLPDMVGTRWQGTFGASGHLAFDASQLDDLDLRYDLQDQCRPVEVPPALSRERFKRPFTQRIYLPDGSTADRTTGPGTPSWTPLESISPFMRVAVLTTEDGGFERHRGFSGAAIKASLIANLKAGRFVRGASTITMQLAKNLFLSRTKTLSRKLEEVVLTDYLEQMFSKDELMELYLNVVELGPSVYGVTDASEFYFGRTPAELNLAECLTLASFLPSPIRYGSMRDGPQVPEPWMRAIRSYMRAEKKRALITDAELAEGLGETVTFWHGGQRPTPRVPVTRRPPADSTDPDEPVVDPPPTDAP